MERSSLKDKVKCADGGRAHPAISRSAMKAAAINRQNGIGKALSHWQ
jgi:hypothetical protein